MNTFVRLLIIFGLVNYLIAGYYVWLRNDPNRLKFNDYAQQAHAQVQDAEKEKQVPVRIRITTLGIDLPIEQASVIDTKWETTNNGVSYLNSSPIPGETGNSVLYGHNWANLLGRLVTINTGTEVEIMFADQTSKTFVVEYTSVVGPNESSILAGSKDKRITLYTCTGFLDAKRFVAVAMLK